MERTHNILIVDDDDLVCRALERQLLRPGRYIVRASSAREGLLKLACFDFAMILSDHLMPDMTGLEMLRIVRRTFPNVVRILVTGHADLDTAIDSINSGEIYRFIVKPWDIAAMQATVSLAIEKHEREHEAEQKRRREDVRASTAAELERRFPGLTHVDSHRGVIILD